MDYKANLESLRKDYIEATPDQRIHIARQRIGNPDHGPNMLVIYVSAIESLARSLAMHQEEQSKSALSSIYSKYRNKGVEALISQYLKKKIDSDPTSFFGGETWNRLKFSIEYRNLLAHECTYLGQDKYPDLLEACEQVLEKLAELEGLKFDKGGTL